MDPASNNVWINTRLYNGNPSYRQDLEASRPGEVHADSFEVWQTSQSVPSAQGPITPSAVTPGRVPARKPVARKALPTTVSSHQFVSAGAAIPPRKALPSTNAPAGFPSAQGSVKLSELGEWRPDPSLYEPTDDAVAQVVKNMHQDAAAKIIQEPSLLLIVRNLILHAPQQRIDSLVKYIREHDHGSEPGDNPAGMDWIEQIGRLRRGHMAPFVEPVTKLTLDHLMYAGIAQTMLLNGNLQTDAQVLSLVPPPNAPINRSFFATTRIPFVYDAEQYQCNFEYRYWVGERTLRLTDTTTMEAFRVEVDYRYNNREKLGVPFVAPPNLYRSDAEYAYDNILRAWHATRFEARLI